MDRTPSRFDYVKYDEISQAKQAKLKAAAQKVEAAIIALQDAAEEMDTVITRELVTVHSDGHSELVDNAREELSEACPGESTAIMHLEQAYMWCGKALRDEQIVRNGSAELQEERKDG